MKKIIAIILISFFILGCRTKRFQKEEIKKEEVKQTIYKTETVQKENIKQSTSKENLQVENNSKSEQKKEVEIKGKTDEKNPLIYYNIVNGDTLDVLKVTGIAEVIYKNSNNAQNSNINSKSSESINSENKAEKSSSNIVENVSKAIESVQTKSVQVVKKDLTFGTYLTFFLWGLVIIGISVLFLWFRKTTFWTDILTKVKKYIK